MTSLTCPIPGCGWKSEAFPPEFAAAANTTLELHAQHAHTQAQQATPAAPPSLKLKPPSVSAGSTPDQWSAFQRQWSMYKTGTAIPTSMVATALFHCCDADLMTDIMRDTQDDVASMSESDLLAAL